MLADAIEIMKYSACEVGNEAENLKHAEKKIRTVVAALRIHDGLLKISINGTHLLYGTIILHGVDLDGMDKYHLIQE